MTDLTLERLYESKNAQYFAMERNLLAALVPLNSRRVLDVGCGSGVLGKMLKQTRNTTEVHGIEINREAAVLAETSLDRVFQVNVENWTPEVEDEFYDAMVMGDVLEHLVDPWAALNTLSRLVKPGGMLITSIPNVRCFRVLGPLIIKGEWAYADWGLLDKGHLRFFTRKSSTRLIEENGFIVTQIKRDLPLSSLSGKINAITFGLFQDFLTSHFIYCAEKKK